MTTVVSPKTYWFHISLSVSRKQRKKSIWFLNDYPTSLLIIVLCSNKNDIVKEKKQKGAGWGR